MLGTPLGRILLDRPAWTYLLGPFFKAATPDAAAPLSATYREAGAVGALTVTQVDGTLATSGGALVQTAQGTAAWGDLGVRSTASVSRLAGRALLVTVTPSGVGAGPFVAFGNGSGVSYTNIVNSLGCYFNSPNLLAIIDSAGAGFGSVGSWSNNTTYDIAIILSATGAKILIRGGAFADWTVLYVLNTGATATLVPMLANYFNAATYRSLRVADLGGAWASDYGIATDRLVSPANNATATMTPDALVEETFVYSAGNLGGFLQYRRQDSANYFYVCALSGGGLYLGEVTASVDTSRASAGGVFSDGVTYRIVVVIVGNVHTIYVNNVKKATYTDASNLRPTATGVLVPSSTPKPTEVVCWPRTVSLPTGV